MHVYTDHGRFYQVGEHKYPGVGTVLNATDTSFQQRFWEKWRADPDNALYSEKAKDRGKTFHAAVEHHFRKASYRLDSQDADDLAAAQVSQVLPFWESVQEILPRISDVQLLESAVWHKIGCYSGTTDMVASFDGTPCILDWKTASKKKYIKYCDRYPLQLTAYCGCINRMYGTKIKHGVIVVALPLPYIEAQVFQFNLGEYWQLWLNRLVAYWQQQTTPLAKQALKAIRSEYKYA